MSNLYILKVYILWEVLHKSLVKKTVASPLSEIRNLKHKEVKFKSLKRSLF